MRVLYLGVSAGRVARAVRQASLAAVPIVLAGACTYDFGKFASSGDQSETDSGSADGSMGADTNPPPGEAGSDTAMLADTLLDVSADSTEDSEAAASDASDTGVAAYTVGGTISSLVGQGLHLTNAGNTLTPASGATVFTFPSQPSGSTYSVAVATQPTAPSQTCAVMNGSGTIAAANVTNVQVACTPTCAPECNDGQMCVDGTDCSSASCQGGTCKPPACAPTCPDGHVCGGNGDCGSGTCMGGNCQAPGCAPACNDGNDCGANADCASRVCTAGKCHAPACAPTCATGSPCGANGDCQSGICRGNHTCR